jgi:transposase
MLSHAVTATVRRCGSWLVRDHANTTRTAAVNLFKSLLLTAPDGLRESLRRLSTPRQTAACAVLRANPREPMEDRVRRQTLRSLALRIRLVDKEIRANERQLRGLVEAVMPALLDEPGVGPVSAAHLLVAWSHPGRCRSEAAFAALAGVSPLEASSGRITRHRPNPFGDRSLNRALHTIVNWRMIHAHEPTQHYLTRRSQPEIRSGNPPLSQALHSPTPVPDHGDRNADADADADADAKPL